MPDHVIEIDQVDSRLDVVMTIADCTPADVIAAFCEPATLRRWWGGGELTFQPQKGGPYVVHFPQLGQTMRGEVVDYAADARLAFTWAWDHEPDVATLQVDITAEAVAGGTQIRLRHGDLAAPSDAQPLREGWEFFLPRLAGCVGSG